MQDLGSIKEVVDIDEVSIQEMYKVIQKDKVAFV